VGGARVSRSYLGDRASWPSWSRRPDVEGERRPGAMRENPSRLKAFPAGRLQSSASAITEGG
jgi:hypothetical protein